MMEGLNRRKFIKNSSFLLAGSTLASPFVSSGFSASKKRVAMVGTGGRGIGMWGVPVQNGYSDILEFVGLCDTNPGRVAYAREQMKVACPVYTDFDKMIKDVKPDTLIVTTTDSTHHEYIIKGLDAGI